MQPNDYPGKLIVLEGLDGAGTTSQSSNLADWLRKYKGLRVWETREPSAGPAGAQIRSVLTRRIKMNPHTLAALFAADRLDHLFGPRGVRQHLEDGEWVIMDRYYHSSFAYQTLALDKGKHAWLWDLHISCLMPDVTFFLDVPAIVCMTRISTNRGFHFELFEKEDVLEQVRGEYFTSMRALRQKGENIQILDGTQPLRAVLKGIKSRIDLILFEPTRLMPSEQLVLWEEYPVLFQMRQDIEEKLGLDFITVKKLAESVVPKRSYLQTWGGYQLEFASLASVYYHIAAHFNRERTTVRFRALGPADKTLEALVAICDRKPIPDNQLHLFRKGN